MAEDQNDGVIVPPLPSQPLPVGGGLRNGKFLNINELFDSGPKSARELAAHARTNGVQPPGDDGGLVAHDRGDVRSEDRGREEKQERVLDEARPPPGPPTMLDIEPPPPGQLQLSGLRTNSSKARPIGALPRIGIDPIDSAADDLVAQIAPSAQEHADLQAAYAEVAELLQDLRPGATAHLYGSAASGLCLRANKDLDVTLQVDGEDVLDRDGQAEVLVELAEGLKSHGMLVCPSPPPSRIQLRRRLLSITGCESQGAQPCHRRLSCGKTFCQKPASRGHIVAVVWAVLGVSAGVVCSCAVYLPRSRQAASRC